MKYRIILVSLFFLIFGSACTVHTHGRAVLYTDGYVPPPPPPRVVHHHETVYVHKRPPHRRVVRHEHYVHHYQAPARYHRSHRAETRRPPRDRGYRRHENSFYRNVSRHVVRRPERYHASPSPRYHDGKRHKKDRHDRRKDRRRHNRH